MEPPRPPLHELSNKYVIQNNGKFYLFICHSCSLHGMSFDTRQVVRNDKTNQLTKYAIAPFVRR